MTSPSSLVLGHASYSRLLLFVSGLGGLLFGIDVGIIAGALPYLEATSGLNAGQLSFIVAAVLLGGVLSTLFAGMLADWLGRRRLMTIAGLLFVASIPIIALSSNYQALVLGRLLQGVSGGLIGVAVPLYLAECLEASKRGRGTGIFQWLLTLGIVAAALIGVYFSTRVGEVAQLGNGAKLLAFKDHAWRSIFWVSLPPGLLFVIGTLLVSESPRWLYRRGRIDEARAALMRSREATVVELEMAEMAATAAGEKSQTAVGSSARESLLRRKYVIPFFLSCVILACNQATGINSIIGYNTTILTQSGLSDVQAHWGYVILTTVNFVVTVAGVALVDRKGRKFLLSLGSAGIIVSLIGAAVIFQRTERQRVDVRDAVQKLVDDQQGATIAFNASVAETLVRASGSAVATLVNRPSTLIVIYSYGGFRSATQVARSDDPGAKPLAISRDASLPPNGVVAFFSNPSASLDAARRARLTIEHALITPIPSARSGWLTAIFIFTFIAFFAIGPGVCVWLALSELMPTRIRSNGMSVALLVNQAVSTGIAATFLPTVGQYGYSRMFFVFAGCTVIYFITAAFFLPETKGRTLEEIEAAFDRKKAAR